MMHDLGVTKKKLRRFVCVFFGLRGILAIQTFTFATRKLMKPEWLQISFPRIFQKYIGVRLQEQYMSVIFAYACFLGCVLFDLVCVLCLALCSSMVVCAFVLYLRLRVGPCRGGVICVMVRGVFVSSR